MQNTRSRATKMPSVSVHAAYERCIVSLISRIHHGAKARPASSKHLGPPFRSPHTLPAEIILQIAELLDEASLQALRHTNRDLFYIISLTPDQTSRLPEACYLAALRRLTVGYDNNRQGFCTNCKEPRPLMSFSVSEVMALDKYQPASCLRHSQFWVCPHVAYDYQDIIKLPKEGKGFCGIDWTGHPCCRKCQGDFRHYFRSGRRFSTHFILSYITVARLERHGGPGMLTDTIQRHYTRALVHKALCSIRAPICDHHLLSHRTVLDAYDPTDMDLHYYPYDALPPHEHLRTARRSDGFCSFCQAMGVQTKFRFRATAYSFRPGWTNIEIEVVLTRSLAACSRRSQNRPDEHWRCHGMTERKLARLCDAGFPNGIRVIPFDEATIC
jgi:hypothetical protein